MKPLQKVVTAQDVDSCLYYVHLDSSEDQKLLEHLTAGDDYPAEESIEEVGASSGGTEVVKRKPLPHAPGTALRNCPQRPPKLHPHYQLPLHGFSQLGQKPVNTAAGSEVAEGVSPNNIRPLHGPRPMFQHFQTVDGTSQEFYPRLCDANPSRWSGQPNLAPPELSPRAGQQGANFRHSFARSSGYTAEEAFDDSSQKSLGFRKDGIRGPVGKDPAQDSGRHISLTLIRRHAGLQSNVGKIWHTFDDKRNGSPTSVSAAMPPLKSSNGTMIEISTPGYRKFVSPFGSSSVSRPGPERVLLRDQRSSDTGFPADGAEPEVVFRRQLHTVPTEKRPQSQHKLNSSNSSLEYPRSRSSLDIRGPGQQTTGNTEVIRPSHPPTSESVQSSNKGHTFESPWHGVCEFHTGITGRSLKCKHTPAPSNRIGTPSASVSELRFNLPSSSALGPPRTQSSTDTSKTSKRSSIFSHHHRAQSASEVQSSSTYGSKVELEERMDLSLGRERAGGGFGGKHAKLGKLIVEEEGLKMLDLVVATNIALWWRVFSL